MIIKRQSFMSPETEQQYKNQIAALQAEIEKLKNQQTKAIQREKYGLNWIDVPEEFDEKSKNSIPVLIEDKNKAIKNADGKPTHILIEGDNYHALTCLNYTHAGKIDVIYIDPPYNTGSDGFTYKDARFMTEFPNGKTVPKDDPLRHSTWLSFMEKRLRLAKNLLSDKGVIFISIDDNEQANLKLLCDRIFGEKNFVANFQRLTTKSGKTPLTFMISHESIIIYAKSEIDVFVGIDFEDDSYKYEDEFINERGKYNLKQPLDCNSISYSKSLDYPIIHEGDTYYPGGDYEKYLERQNGKFLQKDYAWRWSKELFNFGLEKGWIVFKNGRIYTKGYLNASIENINGKYQIVYREKKRKRSTIDFIDNAYSNDIAKKQLLSLNINSKFDYPKPINLISDLIKTHFNNSSTILDFFAGSGTTLHATMKLNAEDGGNRQCILVQQQENDSNICETITYERNRRVIQGYTNAKGEEIAGLGNSLKYYKTDFIGKNKPEKATDEDRISLAQKAGYLISLVENTLEEIETNDFYQIFSDAEENQFTAIYFNGDTEKFPDFVQSIQEKNKKTIVYIFTWGSPDIFENEFDDLSNITIKSIPQPILEIYKSLMKNEE